MSKEAIFVNKKTGEERNIGLDEGRRIKYQDYRYQTGEIVFECKGIEKTCRCRLKYQGGNKEGFFQYSKNYHHAPGCEFDESGKGVRPPRKRRIEGINLTGDNLNLDDIIGHINANLQADANRGGGGGHGRGGGGGHGNGGNRGGDDINEVYVERPPRNPQELFDVAINMGFDGQYAGVNVSSLIFCKETYDNHMVSIIEDETNMYYCICKRSYKLNDGGKDIDNVDGRRVLWLRVYGENRENIYIALKFNDDQDVSDAYKLISKSNRIVVFAYDWSVDYTIEGTRFLKCTIYNRKRQLFNDDED